MNNQSIQQKHAIEKIVAELSKKFLLGHQKSQIKQKKGIVFIGNSRIGKSTISATICGIKMHIVLDGYELKIEPQEQKYRSNKNIIRHTLTSVTQFPNIYTTQINGQLYTVVDLPGFKDTMYEKELCNWHYIKSILGQLDKILFVMVIQVHSESKKIQENEIEMMHRFAQAFPSKSLNNSKENLVTIVNFIQGIQSEKDQHAAKIQIKQKVHAQLTKQGLDKFYSSSFNADRLFLMQKANKKTKQLSDFKNGVQFHNTKLVQFIKKNVLKMQQPQQSSYKINLTKQKTKQSQNLRKVLIQISENMVNSIGEKFQIYKNLFALLLSRMTQTQGVRCQKVDYRALELYYNNKNISIYQTISIPLKHILQNNFESTQQVVYEITALFNEISTKKPAGSFNEKVQQTKIKCFKFIQLMEYLCKNLFGFDDFDRIEHINKNIRKSIHIDCYNLIYLFDSVENFNIQSVNAPDAMFQDNCDTAIYDMYENQFVRHGNFKQELRNYFTKLIKIKQTLPVKRVNLPVLLKLKGACQNMRFNPQKYQAAILYFKTTHKKLHDPYISKHSSKFIEAIQKITQSVLENDQLDQITNWKKTSTEWQYIKNKGYNKILKHLRSTNYNKQKIVELYLKLDNSFDEVVAILRQIISDVEDQEFDKSIAFGLCMKVCQHMIKYWEYHGAQECCALAQRIYQYEDKDKKIEARVKSIQIKNLMLTQLSSNKIRQQLELSPWINISDDEYNDIIKTVNEGKYQLKSSIEEVKQIVSTKALSNPSSKTLERSRSPGRARLQQRLLASEQHEKKAVKSFAPRSFK